MGLLDKIQTDLTTAMKSGDSDRTAVLRLLVAALKNERIKVGHDLGEVEEQKVLAREAKQRKDSVEAYEKGGRAELAEAEKAELTVIEAYLPEQLDEAAVSKLVAEAIAETGASGPQAMGQVIGAVMKKAGGAADGGLVARLVREKLQ